ncbi:phosphatidylcholine and lysophosphatidylcholine phospholipase [Scheffersomyces spartinae]|uniref:Lysophospholipase NTE1 n=1 Tax=Scheffersomyces spartinae TaxID=45513 RepID=A0A9P8AIX6_9ASCO|nr:phosphatidylcholine and lysophosphatidylcholine phospholipase [Scheffersomyces spartinae]KAG7194191.1 phosphatidylcholine and lysophosphatidylcholine phospholipase [Scheffersomyces spartinae]
MDINNNNNLHFEELRSSIGSSISPVNVIGHIVWWILFSLIRLLDWIAIRIPGALLKVLSLQLLIRLSVSSVLIGLSLISAVCYVVVRYTYLTKYSETTQPDLGSCTKPNDAGDDEGLSSSIEKKKRKAEEKRDYLEEFLSGLKVFGYLERQVFHELTRNMTTQRLEEDEVVCLDSSVGFLVVLEGTVQIYIKMDSISTTQGQVELDEKNYLNLGEEDRFVLENQRYQLLNEVKSGSHLSSLLNIVDLFSSLPKSSELNSPGNTTIPSSPYLHSDGGIGVGVGDGVRLRSHTGSGIQTGISLPTLASSSSEAQDNYYPEILIKAKTYKSLKSANIAIVPASAFRRIEAKFPKSTSHIITMVLMRLSKVTFNTFDKYLEMTRELMDCEARLNKMNTPEVILPRFLTEGIIEKVKQERERGGEHDRTIMGKRKSRETSSVSISSSHSEKSMGDTTSRYVVLNSRMKSSLPGDLLSSVPISRTTESLDSANNSFSNENSTAAAASTPPPISLAKRRLPHPISRTKSWVQPDFRRPAPVANQMEETEEKTLLLSIVESIFKILGINQTKNMESCLTRFNSNSVNNSFVDFETLLKSNGGPGTYAGFQEKCSLSFEPIAEMLPMESVAYTLRKGDGESSCNGTKLYSPVNVNIGRSREPLTSSRKEKRESFGGSTRGDINYDFIKEAFSEVVEIHHYVADSVLVKQGEYNSGLWYVIDGELQLDYVNRDSSKLLVFHTVTQGGIAGYLSTVVGYKALATIKTPIDKGAIIAHIPKADFSRLLDKFYFLQITVARRLKSLFTPELLTIDYALEWTHIKAGEVLSAQGEEANGLHIVLSGRFRAIRFGHKDQAPQTIYDADYEVPQLEEFDIRRHDKNYQEYEVLREYGHGDSIGEVEVLTAAKRSNSLIAVRDSETARIPRTLFEMLATRYPSLMIKISRLVAQKMATNVNVFLTKDNYFSNTPSYISNDYKTITIIPNTRDLPVREFAERLVSSFKAIGRNVIALDQALTLTHLGKHAFDESLLQLRLSGYFAYLEEQYESIVYICDTPLKSTWTQTCIAQGDCILLLADAEDDASRIGEYEKLLISANNSARTDLCLLHPDRYVVPGSVSKWLKNRSWVLGHHNLQMEVSRSRVTQSKQRMNIFLDFANIVGSKTNPNLKHKLENVKDRAVLTFAKLNARFTNNHETNMKAADPFKNDFHRLARILSNEAVGLVLGGGGSRGISHLGVVMALEKHGIPVDLIGGTSIGSFVGGLYAKDYNVVSIFGRVKMFCTRISSHWRLILDMTYPVTSYITGYEFNRGIWKAFGAYEIEDFWIKYFCNSTNITNSTMDLHETGYLWRFIRASMSLAGLLPPVTYNGCMLLDGGYIDNLPVIEMKKKGAKHVIAVDVGSLDDRTPQNYGDTLSGFWVLFNRWNPFSKYPNVPSMMDIQLRLAYVASVNALEIAKKTPGVYYLRPPIDNYATLDFAKFDEIYKVGFEYADELFTKWIEEKSIPPIAGLSGAENKYTNRSKGVFRRNSI